MLCWLFCRFWDITYCYSLTGICCETRLIIFRYFKIAYKVVVNHNSLCLVFTLTLCLVNINVVNKLVNEWCCDCRVVEVCECPRAFETVFMSTPLLISRVAFKCLKLCIVLHDNSSLKSSTKQLLLFCFFYRLNLYFWIIYIHIKDSSRYFLHKKRAYNQHTQLRS